MEQAFPSKIIMLLSFVKALCKFVWSGCKRVDSKERQLRLDQCNLCKWLCKKHKRCAMCGCFVVLKTWCKLETCPKGYWK